MQETRNDRTYIPIQGCAYRLGLIAAGMKSEKLIYATWDGTVACQSPENDELEWTVSLDGFPFGLSVCGADGDDRSEVFIATAGGSLYAIQSGNILWHRCWGMPLYGAAAARFTMDGVSVVTGGVDRKLRVLSHSGEMLAETEAEFIVHRVLAVDLDGDGLDEIVYLDGREILTALKLTNGSLETLWRKELRVPEEMRNWENPRGGFFAFDIAPGLPDENSRGSGGRGMLLGDAYFNKQRIMALDSSGETLWITDPLDWWTEEDRWYEFYSTAFVTLTDTGIIAVSGGEVRLFDRAGKLLKHARSRLGFTDAVFSHGILYLGSTPNGDETIYRIRMTGDWARTIENLEPQGLARDVEENLQAVYSQVLGYAGEAPADRGPYVLLSSLSGFPSLDNFKKRERSFNSRIPYDNIKAATSCKVIENSPPLNPDGKPWSPQRWQTDSILGTMSQDEIVERAEYIEEHRIPTYFTIGHSCMPFITLETAERMLRAAPNYLLGFVSAEDEQIGERGPAYFRHFFGPLADLCAQYGYKECVTKNKNSWWAAAPALQPIYEELFRGARSGERGKVLVAETEDSNSRTPEINLFARAGLRMCGLVDRVRASTHMDLFSYCRFHQWEYPRNGSAFLRLLVAHTALGCNSYRDSGLSALQQGDEFIFTRLGREYLETLCHMVGKGILVPPSPDEMVGFSPVGIVMHSPPEKWLQDGFNGHRPWLWNHDPELEQAVIPHNGCEWGNSPTPPHALQAVALNKRRQFGYFIPPTPYGPFLIVPSFANRDAVTGVTKWWHTDGVFLWQDAGERIQGPEAADALRKSFEHGARELPFKAFGDDVFIQTLRMDDGRYRIYLVDPGWIDPAERHISLRVQLPDAYRFRDLLSGEDIQKPFRDGARGRENLEVQKIAIAVPAGVFRIIEAIPVSRGR